MNQLNKEDPILTFDENIQYDKLISNWQAIDAEPPSRSEFIAYNLSNDTAEYERIYNAFCNTTSIYFNRTTTTNTPATTIHISTPHNEISKTIINASAAPSIQLFNNEKEKEPNQEENDMNDDKMIGQEMDTPTTSSLTTLSKHNITAYQYHDKPMDGFIRIFIFNVNEIPKLRPKIKDKKPLNTKDIHVGWRDVRFFKGKLEVDRYITLPSVPNQTTKDGQKICGVLKCTTNNFSSETTYLQHIQDVHYKNILKVFCPHPDCIESSVTFQNFRLFYQHSKEEHQIQNKLLTTAIELYTKGRNSRGRGSGKNKKQIAQKHNQLQHDISTTISTRKSKRTNMPTFKAKEAEQESRPRKYKRKVMNPKLSQTQNIPNLDEYEKMSNAYEQLKIKYELLKEENQFLREFKENENKDEFLATIIQDLRGNEFQVCSIASKLEILRNAKNSN